MHSRLKFTAAATTTAVMTAVLLVGAPSSASASDWGGDGWPNVSCPNAWTVKSTPIKGSRGNLAGKVIGQLEIRWSSTCYGNWARVVLYGNMYPNAVTVEQVISAEGRQAGATDRVTPGKAGTSTYTRYIRLNNANSTACAQVWASSDFGTLNFHTNGASLCA